MEDRKTIRSGLPRELSEELSSLAPSLIEVPGARFRLERVVGRGALFVTFRATRIDSAGAVPHAVKVFRPSLLAAWPAGARILSREQLRVLSLLNERVPPSPHVVRLYEVSELTTAGVTVPFFALEWIDNDDEGFGASLFDRVRGSIATHGVALDPIASLRILEGVCRGLDWVHRHGLLHRGLSPSNVLVTGRSDAPTAKVSDVAIARPGDLPTSFGLAAETVTRSAEPYRAPEQHDPRAMLTPACDVFALGALTHFVITGRQRIPGESLRVLDSVHPAFESLTAIDAVVTRLCAFDAEDRPATIQSAWELLEPALRQLAAATSKGAPSPATSNAGSWMWTERHRPAVPKELRAIAVDPDGHALATDAGAIYFDGRNFRKPAPCAELEVIKTIRCIGAGTFLVGGRTARGRARLCRLDAEGWVQLPIDASGSVVATLPDGGALIRDEREVSLVDLRGRIPLPGLRTVAAVLPLGELFVILGSGGSFTVDLEQRIARPQRLPETTAAISTANELYLACELGALLVVRAIPAGASSAGHRLQVAREQIPTGTATALSVAPDGKLILASGGALLIRDAPNEFRTVFSELGAAPCIALAPRQSGLLAFLRDGRVIEGRALMTPAR